MRCRLISLGLKVLVLVFTLVLGVSLTRIVRDALNPHKNLIDPSHVISVRADSSKLTRVDYCDLMAAPESYEGKLLLLTFKPREPGMMRKDELCLKGNPQFDLKFSGYDFSEAFWNGGEIRLFGRFTKRPFGGDSHKYEFQVFQIYEARLFVAPQ